MEKCFVSSHWNSSREETRRRSMVVSCGSPLQGRGSQIRRIRRAICDNDSMIKSYQRLGCHAFAANPVLEDFHSTHCGRESMPTQPNKRPNWSERCPPYRRTHVILRSGGVETA